MSRIDTETLGIEQDQGRCVLTSYITVHWYGIQGLCRSFNGSSKVIHCPVVLRIMKAWLIQ